MKHLTIKNVGPIRVVDMELNRFNFLIGPQSCGKSTIAKILSTCKWIEKESLTALDENVVADGKAFLQLVENFHKLDGYFGEESFVDFESDYIHLHYEAGNFKITHKALEKYSRPKICYIPSERNLVTLPELQGFEFGQTNLRSFLFDWFNARDFFAPENKTDVLNLGVKYFYDASEFKLKDRIEHSNGMSYGIALGSASSGLQSVVPMIVMLRYYTDEYFHAFEEKTSFDLDLKTKNRREKLIDELVLKRVFPEFKNVDRRELIMSINEGLHSGNPEYKKLLKSYQDAFKRLTVPSKTIFIIEEPEQNLYPSTQMSFIDMLVSLCQGKCEHEFLLTTHSPYILNQLNLLVKRNDVGVKEDGIASLDWNDVSVWAIEDGGIRDLKLRNAHLINPEYLSAPLDQIYEQYERL